MLFLAQLLLILSCLGCCIVLSPPKGYRTYTEAPIAYSPLVVVDLGSTDWRNTVHVASTARIKRISFGVNGVVFIIVKFLRV